MKPLEQLAAEIAEAHRLGCVPAAAALERWAGLSREALTSGPWVSEDRAVERSRHARRWFRVRFPTWEALGYARERDKRREYHEAVVPIPPAKSGLAESPEEQARRDIAA